METPKVVLFLCSGNYYRSRYAEILFNSKSQTSGLGWQAFSRGLELSAQNPGPMSLHTQTALTKLEILLDEHLRFPLAVTEEDFRQAGHIVAVKEAEHRAMLTRKFPHWLERVEFWHIDDLDCSPSDHALPRLDRHVDALLERLAKREVRPLGSS